MRVLVVGTVPPPGGSVAYELCRVAAQRVAQGDEVELLSPDLRSAAHRQARLSGIWLAIALARSAPRFDELVLRIETDLPLRAETGRISRAVTLIALGMTLRLFKQVTLRLDTPISLPGGLGGRATSAMWNAATTIVVANDEDAKNVRAIPGIDAEQVVIEEPAPSKKAAHFEGWDVDLAGNLREQVSLYVRERAVRDRNVGQVRTKIGVDAPDVRAHSPFAGSQLVNPNLVEMARFGLSKARRRAAVALSRSKS